MSISPKLVPGVVNIMNTTTIGLPEETVELQYLEDPGDWRYLGVFVGFLVVVLGTAGNGVTVWAYTRNKNLQTSFNVLIANLCLVELFFSAVVIPLTLPGFITGHSIYPPGFCSFVGFLYYTSLACSLHNLVAIAVNRYVGIVKSEIYQRLFSGQRLAICIASIWLTAPLLYLPVIIGNAIAWRPVSLRCAIGTIDVAASITWYNMGLNICFQAVPLLILIVLYTSIFRKVKQVQKKLKHHKRSSFRRSSGKSKAAVSTSRIKSTGNTSDDTGDEFKPSSLIEGVGHGFKPIIADKSSNTGPSDSSHNFRKEGESSPTPEPLSPTEDSAKSEANGYSTAATASDDEDKPKPPPVIKKRNSLWQILLRNSKITTSGVDSIAEDKPSATVSQSSDNNLTEDDAGSTSKLATENDSTANLPKLEIEHRENQLELPDIRRKKSLSAPTLPNIDFTNPNNFKNTLTLPQESTVFLSENEKSELETLSGENKMFRARSAYYKRSTGIHNSSSHNDISPLKTATSWSVRLDPRKRAWSNSITHRHDSDGESTQRTRVGTIARKIQDRKHKATRKERKRQQRQRMLRKKHARERQLVYSSLTICVAYALCILPIALLYLIQVLFEIEVAASVGLVITCIAWLHAVINPLIYGYLNSQYRREYGRIFRCMKQRLFKGKNAKCDMRK